MIASGIDLSSFQRLPAPDWWRKVRDLGYYVAVVQLWGANPLGGSRRSQYAAAQLAGAAGAGFPVLGGYIVIPPDTTTRTDALIAEAAKAAGDFAARLDLIAFDLEIPKPLHPQCPIMRLLDAAAWAMHYFPRAKPLVYTRAAVWRTIMIEDNPWPGGKPTMGLWEARWVGPNDPTPKRAPDLMAWFVPFGGWFKRTALQYAGGVNLFGVQIDINRFDLDALGIQIPT